MTSVAADVKDAQHETVKYSMQHRETEDTDWLIMTESSQHIKGVREDLQLIFDGLQPQLDLQGVIQHLYTVGVWVKPHRKRPLDAGDICSV